MGESDPRSIKHLLSFACLASYVSLAISILVLAGWIGDIAALNSIIPGYASIKPLTAVGFVLAAVSLGLSGACWRLPESSFPRAARGCAWIVAILGLITVAEYASGLDTELDTFMVHGVAAAEPHPGRMSPASAAGLLLLGIALLSLDAATRPARRLSQ